jgi:hypothetical protein
LSREIESSGFGLPTNVIRVDPFQSVCRSTDDVVSLLGDAFGKLGFKQVGTLTFFVDDGVRFVRSGPHPAVEVAVIFAEGRSGVRCSYRFGVLASTDDAVTTGEIREAIDGMKNRIAAGVSGPGGGP